MKILNRNYEHRNLILFVFLSQIYLQTIYSLSYGISAISLDSFQLFFTNHYFIFFSGLVTVMMVMSGKKHSDKVLLVFLCLVTGKNFILLASSFNKMILILNFIYLVFAFYFYMSWDVEISKACFNPLFTRNDLEKSNRFSLEGRILDSNQNVLEEVTVSNIDENSCFVILKNHSSATTLKGREFVLVSILEGVEFRSQARLTTVYDLGFGFELLFDKNNTKPEWSELYKVCLERGLYN